MRFSVYYVEIYWVYKCFILIFFFKQKTAYEIRISDWSSDVCSSDLIERLMHVNTGGDNIAIAVDDVHQSLDLLGGAVREHACFFVVPPEISGQVRKSGV